IAGRLTPSTGKVERGATVQIGYYDQLGRDLDLNQRVRDAVAGDKHEPTLDDVKLMRQFWFDGDAQFAPISTLSGGEKQRLSIIRSLAHDPALLILDEPVSALDPVGRREFLRELIDNVIERETTVVFSTHILSDLERVALDLAFLTKGTIALQGGLDELLEHARRVSAPHALLDGLRVAGELSRVRNPDGTTQVVTRETDAALLALAAREPAMRIEALSLEDLFIAVTQ
ncbi:MAG: ATP-binding cassette domain-containing protein, partial [Massilia sp.]